LTITIFEEIEDNFADRYGAILLIAESAERPVHRARDAPWQSIEKHDARAPVQ
jgi:hypothetical protein